MECKGLCSECVADNNCTQCKPDGFLQGTSKKWLRREALQHEGKGGGQQSHFSVDPSHGACLLIMSTSCRFEEDLRKAVPSRLLQGERQEDQQVLEPGTWHKWTLWKHL